MVPPPPPPPLLPALVLAPVLEPPVLVYPLSRSRWYLSERTDPNREKAHEHELAPIYIDIESDGRTDKAEVWHGTYVEPCGGLPVGEGPPLNRLRRPTYSRYARCESRPFNVLQGGGGQGQSESTHVHIQPQTQKELESGYVAQCE